MAKYSKFLVQGEAPVVSFPCLEHALGRSGSQILQKIHYLLHHSTLSNVYGYKIERKNHDKKRFLGISFDGLLAALGILSISTLKRNVKYLCDVGVLRVEKLAKNAWMRMNYYRIDYAQLEALLGLDFLEQNQASDDENVLSSDDLNQDLSHKVKIAQEQLATTPNTEPLAQGNEKPSCQALPLCEQEKLPQAVRKLYVMLRSYRVDIGIEHDIFKRAGQLDPQKIAQHILSVKSGYFANFWHTPEQLGFEKI